MPGAGGAGASVEPAMSRLRVEVRNVDGEWASVGELGPDDQPGSMSHNHDGQREILMFTCCGSHSTVEMSVAGLDLEWGPAREIHTGGFTEIARIGPGETFERLVIPDGHRRKALRVRWTHVDA